MDIKFKYSIKQTVLIKELEYAGVIISAWTNLVDKKYEILYYVGGERKSDYFFEWELSENLQQKFGF